MSRMNCQTILESIRGGLSDWTRVIPLDSGECLVRLPFWDGAGDPVELTVAVEEGRATIDDAGSIAGLLFSLGQDEQRTPAFKLLEDLGRTHGLEIDFDEGLVKVSLAEGDLYDGITEMAKVVLAMHTVVPHMRVSQRRLGSFGPRLKSRVARKYRELDILDLLERSYPLAGATVSNWPIDFHWSVGRNGNSYDVNVVTADLNVAQPLEKAQKIAALSIDTREQHQPGIGLLRVVIESQDDNAQALKAQEFLRFHSDELDYRVFDLRSQDESSEFYDSSVRELTTDIPGSWAELLSSKVN